MRKFIKSMRSINQGTRSKVVVRFLAAAIVLQIYLLWQGNLYFNVLSRMPLRDAQSQLALHLYPLLEEHVPRCSPPKLRGNVGAGLQRFDAVNGTPQKNYLDDPGDFEPPMQLAHDGYVRAIKNTTLQRAYTPRRRESCPQRELPVELFLKDWTEYEPYICEIVLPPLNAKCVVLSELLVKPDGGENNLEHFQLKVFAILFSSFQDVIWMDSDCLFLHDPTKLLSSKPYTSTGLVTWPDFWAYTISPSYYNISRQAEIPTTTRQSTEAGMFLISKKKHFMTLLLAAYYNFHAEYYYTMISQGAPGEGDKDTFILAASALGRKFYTVSEKVADLGHPADDGGVLGSAMLQADPVEDYKLTRQGKWRVRDESVAKAPRGFWIHAYNPKFNAGGGLFSEKSENDQGNPSRLWTHQEETLKRIGYDVERMAWEEAKTVTCTLEHGFDTWKKNSGLCKTITKHWEAVFKNSTADAHRFTEE
ncbi:hypothetical protein ETB97_008153 [Aspergillus alliaceus]|uniref:Nucleotide-diphospho-sugar transferase n=1 Tax=Petromyces alliaceus TaxID=209559 RepID=A0A8H5ZX15_PETAA|nr:hypothetical protein ETB97_008153 [Aspergillus burnettii]